MSEFFEILKLETGPAKYEIRPNKGKPLVNWFIGMVGYDFPRSVYLTEFEFLKNLVLDYDLKSGFEVATAFGLSTVALGVSFKKNNGRLVSMDAYIEEHPTEWIDYRYNTPTTNLNSMGFKSAKFLIEYFRLKDVVNLEIGFSPFDVGRVISTHLNDKLDFVFIDAGHFPEQLIKDLQSVIPFLDDEYVIVLHDCYEDMITPEVERFIDDTFGFPLEIRLPYPEGNNMGLLINKQKKN